jgi:hypothetical protein
MSKRSSEKQFGVSDDLLFSIIQSK